MEKIEYKEFMSHVLHGVKFRFKDSDKNELWNIWYRDDIDYNEMKYPLSTLYNTLDTHIMENKPVGFELILRPLEHLNEKHIEELSSISDGSVAEEEWLDHMTDLLETPHEIDFNQCPYRFHNFLLSKHFDIFHLIPKGYARSVSVLKTVQDEYECKEVDS